jgi:transcriptional regulator with XRE-family HTH domain
MTPAKLHDVRRDAPAQSATAPTAKKNAVPVSESSARRTRNEKLKALRLSLNLSQAEFATAVRTAGNALGEPNTCTRKLVQRWESGTNTLCPQRYRRALQSVTCTPYAELGFADATPLLTSISDLLTAAEDASPSLLPHDDTSDLLRYALARPEIADTEAVDLVTESTAYLFGLENHQPARVMLPAVTHHIRDIATLLSGTHNRQLRRSLTVAGGQSAALAGWLSFNLGDTAAAHRYWDSAMAAARSAADGPLLACVLTQLSYSAADRGDPNTAWQLAHAAFRHAGDNPRAQAWMAVRAAQEAAQLSDPGAALAELEIALDLMKELDPAAPEDDAQPWCRFVDRAYILAMAANVYSRLGGSESAYTSAVRALDSLSIGQTKTRALILAEAAHAFTRIGGTERATRYVAEGIALASWLENHVAHDRLDALTPLLGTASDLAVNHKID